MPKARTIKSATYTPASKRNDTARVNGDVTYVTFVECDHIMCGNPTMFFKVGSYGRCWECAEEEQNAQSA